MVKDQAALQNIQASWKTVRTVQGSVGANLASAMGMFGGVSHNFRDLAHSLVLLFAFSVLEDTLKQLRDESAFTSDSSQLGKLMERSETPLPWVDFAKVDAGRECRNNLAHEMQVPSRADSWKYIDAIENELVGWGVLPENV